MTSNQSPSRQSPSWPRPALALSLLVAAGCPSPDAEGKYDRFNEQTQDQRDLPMMPDLPPLPLPGDTDTDSGTTGGPPDPSGVYLLAIDTTIAPGLPLQFLADVQAELDYEFTGTVSLEIQPLSLDPMSTTLPREEVGDSIAVEADVMAGVFTVEFPGVTMVTGAANPITGSDIAAVISLNASFRSEATWCGDAVGMVQSPIMAPIDGSMFAAVLLADRSERPLHFPCSCMTIDLAPGSENGCIPNPM
jgi:hypothetical protein